ncbi:MAG: Crp/Fnr family transcriptional regulator [Hydrogenophaga sp.]|uniref:Crp/Fnr family transcriptional regulator n=1 Tax=Hydrogenophaga sp. TaxID=1904254 RepID=UPI002ABCF11A|nr:Crp/Fnr family transcriptional regulator [Hydrogenophaga sp.]MDZ4282089.1 Crp/Fnr family transcriptional regulator [Hydrogenophaga sp.]
MTELDSRKANRLLALLPDTEWRRWQPLLELQDLTLGTVLQKPNEPLLFAYFPTTVVTSLQYEMRSGISTQFAMVGYEGMVAASSYMGSETALSRAVVTIEGKCLRLPVDMLRSSFYRSRETMHLLLRYAQTLMTQMSHTALCNRHHLLDQRLCCLLLNSLDRNQGNDPGELVITHDLISNMLGVRREGVTEAAQKLQAAGLIKYARGRVSLLDRLGLERTACECYQAVQNDYSRLLANAQTTSV